MKHNFSTKLLISIVVLIGVVSLLATGAAAAQENTTSTDQTTTAEPKTTETASTQPADTETATPESRTENPRTAENESDQDETTYLIEIDQFTRIVNSSWSDGTVTFIVESDKRQRIKITDSSIDVQAHEAVDIPQARHRLPEGRTEVTFTVTNPGSSAITVATPRGMVGLSPGKGSGALIGGPYTASDAQASGVGVGLSISLLVMFKVLRRLRSNGGIAERVA